MLAEQQQEFGPQDACPVHHYAMCLPLQGKRKDVCVVRNKRNHEEKEK